MKIIRKTKNNNNPEVYDNYLALDWSKNNASVARINNQSNNTRTIQMESNVKILKDYFKKIKGSKVLTIEETTTSHWLYVELRESVNKVIICNPLRNKLLSEGPKTDKIDAEKLCKLLKAGLIKEVYHSMDEDYKIRKLVSSYEDLVNAGIRIKNQRAAFYLSEGLNHKKDKIDNNDGILSFIDTNQARYISLYKEEKKEYESKISQIVKKNTILKSLCQISGIGEITAITIYSKVIDASRFENKYKYWSYCGLAKNEKWSGGKLYGKRNPKYSRRLKGAYKIAAFAAITHKNDIREYYDYLLTKGLSADKARHEIARYIAKTSYAMMKNRTNYIPYSWRKEKE